MFLLALAVSVVELQGADSEHSLNGPRDLFYDPKLY